MKISEVIKPLELKWVRNKLSNEYDVKEVRELEEKYLKSIKLAMYLLREFSDMSYFDDYKSEVEILESLLGLTYEEIKELEL